MLIRTVKSILNFNQYILKLKDASFGRTFHGKTLKLDLIKEEQSYYL